MAGLNLFVQFILALPKVWSIFTSIMDELRRMKEKQIEQQQKDAIEKLKASKPNTEDRKDALRKWVDSNRD
jgi:hypothetical protein